MQTAARHAVEDGPAPGVSDTAQLQIAITKALEFLKAVEIAKTSAVLYEVAEHAAANDNGSYVFGLFFFNTGDLGKALEWFDRGLALNRDFKEALQARGFVLHQLGRPLEALTVFEELRRRDPQSLQALHMCAIILQGLGWVEEALAAYEEILHIAPEHCDALVNRGVALDSLGRLEGALACFDKVAKLRPGDGANLFNRGSVLQRLDRYEEALAAYDAVKRSGEPNPELEVNRGNVLQSLGQFAAALSCYDAAVGLRPGYAQAHYNRGIALQRLRQPDAALRAYEAAIAAKPAYPEAYCNRGNVLAELGGTAEALASFAMALKLRPGFVPALINRAKILFEQGSFEAALAACADVLDKDPNHAQAWCIRGAALHRMERLCEALASLDRAVRIRPDLPEAWLNRGNVLQEQGEIEKALASYDYALGLRPEYPEVISSRGVALKELGRLEEALAAFDYALQLKPDFPDARNNRAGILLLKGAFKRGFADFEFRWERTNAPRKTLTLTLPIWNGEPLQGRRLLVWDEQGLGDLMHFCRYLPQLVAEGADVSFYSRKNMFRLLSSLPRVPRLLHRIDELEHYDFQIALMSLPYVMGTDRDTIPAVVPYLSADKARADTWAKRIGSDGYKIGICWRGNPRINLDRNVPLAFFGALAAIPGVRLISLMKDAHGEPAETAKSIGLEFLGEDFDRGPDSFADTAAVMANLNLIVTSDTSIVHLAGALGHPVFLALKWIPDWRWLAEGDTSPWYPTMRLFRQRERGAWGPVLEAMARAVKTRMADEQAARA